jgi:2-polyprenyl-3-methyl-5-hydroxy-6-metoxy-1,4-benzoquinol methylase
MKPLGIIFLLTIFQVAASAQQSPRSPADMNADGEIRQQSERYFNAIEHHDVKTLDDLLLDECLICYPRGVGDTKASLLKALAKPLPAVKPLPTAKSLPAAKPLPTAGGPAKPTYTLGDVKVRRVGAAAVLTATLTAKRVDSPGVINNHRRTLVWVRQNHRWRLMHDQWSLAGDAWQAEYWSDFFHGKDQNFKRAPNSLLVEAVKGRRPGKALDVGMGQGRNAIYLARQGWKVTGIDRAEGALAVARQEANKQGLRITPILQAAEEFDWGHQQWDLVALLYVGAVRGNVAKIRESLRPGGLVVIEAFIAPPGQPASGADYEPRELRKMFADGFKILRYEEAEGVADYGQARMKLVRLIASRL